MGVHEHKQHAPKKVGITVLSVSSTRSLENDESGLWIKEYAERKGHHVVFHEVIADNQAMISEAVSNAVRNPKCEAVLVTGGTGISPSDLTIEAVRPLFRKELTGFSSLFTMLSYKEVGSAAMLSRSVAGLIGKAAVFCMPGSLKACKMACKNIIFSELGHIIKHAFEGSPKEK